MTIVIRRARPGEAPALTEIAHAAKRHWRYPERWIELWRDQLTLSPEFIAEHEVYVAERDGEPVGFYALLDANRGCNLEHLWVRPELIRSGVGSALFKHAAARAAECQAEHLEIDSDPNAEGFYVRMGARRIGETAPTVEGQARILPRMRLDLPTGT